MIKKCTNISKRCKIPHKLDLTSTKVLNRAPIIHSHRPNKLMFRKSTELKQTQMQSSILELIDRQLKVERLVEHWSY